MRLTFLCSSLEPGRDGVGDYTRRLGSSLARLGHTVQAIALNDRFVDAASQFTEASAGIETIRVPARMSWAERIAAVRPPLAAFAPDCLSLQFVPYGFADRGLVWGLGARLLALAPPPCVHVMFHELWIGEAEGASVKRRIVGGIQKRLILKLVRDLAPTVVQTQASPYVDMLRRHGIAASRLPLFGNIAVNGADERRWVVELFREAGQSAVLDDRDGHWLLGLFGTIHPEWQAEPLLSRLQALAAAQHKKVALLAIGRLGASGDRIWSELTSTHPALPRIRSGEQPAARISQLLRTIDFGVAASPLALVGKSGTIAAMLDHGLPVIVTRDDVSFSVATEVVEARDALIIPLDERLEHRLLNVQRRQPHETVNAVAESFINTVASVRACAS